jgi:hypothetical protein
LRDEVGLQVKPAKITCDDAIVDLPKDILRQFQDSRNQPMLLKWSVRFFSFSVALFFAWLLTLQFELLPRLSTEQKQALAFMRDQPALGKRNALATMYLLRHDVAPERIESTFAALKAELAASLRQRANDQEAGNSVEENPYKVIGAQLDQRFAALLPTETPSVLCATTDACLAKVQQDPESMRAALAAFSKLPARLKLLRDFDSLDLRPLAPDMRLPMPYLLYGTPMLSQQALIAVDGRPLEAMAGICELITTARRLRNTNSLIVNMIGVNHIQRGVRLISEIQAANPGLSADCAAALAPLSPVESQLCTVMRGEFAMSSLLFDQFNDGKYETDGKLAKPIARWLMKISVNAELSKALMAQELMRFCQYSGAATFSSSAKNHSATDAPESRAAPPEVSCSMLENLTNPAGCWIFEYARPNFSRFVLRVRDADTHLRLLALTQFARTSAAANCPEDLHCAPDSIRLDNLKHEPQARTLSVQLLAGQAGSAPDQPPTVLLMHY